jgi:putative hemolysin
VPVESSLASEGELALNLVELLLVPALVALNALFVAAEFALVAVRKTQIEELVRHGHKRAKIAEGAIDRLDRSIAATQLGITLASLGLGWIGEPALAHLLEPLCRSLPGTWSAVATHTAATVLAFLLITFMHVVFGELVPKNMA